MQVSDFFQPEHVVMDLAAPSKLKALQTLSAKAIAALGISEHAVFDPLYAREKLGSTGIGEGIAIPHTRVAGIAKPFGMLARLAKPIDFESIDEVPVDLVFVLLIPEQDTRDHLNVLAAVARQLRSPDILRRLRRASSAGELYSAITAGA